VVCVRCGDEVMELLLSPDAEVEFCRETSGRVISMLGRALAWTDWSLGAATPETLVFAALARLSRIDRADRVERFEEERWRRVVVGMMVVEPTPVVLEL
jgi:hypothetical protein